MKRGFPSLFRRRDGDETFVWHPVDRPYPRLADLDQTIATLSGSSGLLAIWHMGVRPQWLRILASRNLSASMATARTAQPLTNFHPNGGIYAAWMIQPIDRACGMAAHLTAALQPILAVPLGEELPLAVTAIPCPFPPGVLQPGAA